VNGDDDYQGGVGDDDDDLGRLGTAGSDFNTFAAKNITSCTISCIVLC